MSSGVSSIADDTADKVRRNLVVFSAVVIAVPALEAQISGKFFALDSIEQISQWRAWFAVLIVLGYLYYRYKLDPKTETRRKKLVARRVKSSTDILTGLAQREFNDLANGIAPSGVKFELSPLPHPEAHFSAEGRRRLNLTGYRGGQIEFDTYTVLNDQKYPAGVGYATFQISRVSHLKAKIQAWLAHNKLDHEMLDLRFPFYVAALAAVISIWNLGRALQEDYRACELWIEPAECSAQHSPQPPSMQWKLELLKRSPPTERTPPVVPARS